MVKTAQPGTAGDLRIGGWSVLDGSPVWSILLQRIVSPILMVIADVFANEPSQMAFIQRDDVVQKFPTTASDPVRRQNQIAASEDVTNLEFTGAPYIWIQ